MTGEFDLKYNYDEYLDAYWLHLRKQWMWKGALRYVAVLGTIVFLIVASQQFSDHGFSIVRLLASAITGLVVACVGLLVLAAFWRWSVPRMVRRIYDQLGNEGRSTRYRFDQTELVIEDHAAGARLEWRELASWTENDQFLMLYRTDHMFYYVPKRQVDSTTLEALKARLRAAPAANR